MASLYIADGAAGMRDIKALLGKCSGAAAPLLEPETKLKKTRFRLGTVQGAATCQQLGQLGRAPCSTIGPVWGPLPGSLASPRVGMNGPSLRGSDRSPFMRCCLDCDG